MKRSLRSVAVLAGFALACGAWPTDGRSAETRGGWTSYTNRSDVRALFETGDTLWVATNCGVLLVSVQGGGVISTLTIADGLADNSTRSLYADAKGVFIGSDGGLDVCRVLKDRLSVASVGRFADVRFVGPGASGDIRVGTFGGGAARIAGDRIAWVTTADSLLDDKVFCIADAGARGVFYATSLGLCARRDSAWVSFQAGSGFPRGEVRELARKPETELDSEFVWEQPALDLYVLVAGQGIYRFDGGRAREVPTQPLFAGSDAAAIGVSADGSLWAAGSRGGIGRCRDGVWERFGEDDDVIAHARWRSLHVGESGMVYLGSADGVIAAADGAGVRKITIPSDLSSGTIGPAAEDSTGRKFFANGPYLVSIKNDAAGFTREIDLGSVLAISVSPNGDVWAAGRWGLYRRGTGGWEEVVPDVDPRPPLFTSLSFDSAGCLWAGSEAGDVWRFDGQLWIRLTAPGDLPDAPIERLAVDASGHVFAAERKNGVFVFDGSSWRTHPIEEFGGEIVDVTVGPTGRAIVLTPDGLWRRTDKGQWERRTVGGVKGSGDMRIIRFDRAGNRYLVTGKGIAVGAGDRAKWLAPHEGLRGKDVTSILIDRDGLFWVGFRTEGLSRISLVNLR